MQEDLITTNIKKIDEALEECTYIIDRYTVTEKTGANPKTNRQAILDYKVMVYPTKTFQQEQYRLNVHHKNIREHRVTDDGKAIIKPMRDQYPATSDYQQFLQDKDEYDSARQNK